MDNDKIIEKFRGEAMLSKDEDKILRTYPSLLGELIDYARIQYHNAEVKRKK